MMKTRNVLSLAIACLLAACQPAPVPGGPVAAPEALPDPTPAPVAPAPARLRGQMLIGKDGYAITACGSTAQQIVELSESAKAMLDRFAAGGALEFHADAWTRDTGMERPRVEDFEQLATESAGCDEDLAGKTLIARGTEPFWSLTAWPDRLVFERPDADKTEIKVDASALASGGLQLRAEGVELDLVHAPCSDGMSDTLYGWQVSLRHDGGEWKGCGYRGTP